MNADRTAVVGTGGVAGQQGPSVHAAPWSVLQRWVSVLVLALLGGVSVTVGQSEGPAGPRLAALAAVGVVLLGCVMAMVRGYVVDAHEITVQRGLGRTRLPLRGLVDVRADPRLVRGSIRLFGNGGFLSTTGVFWNRTLGRYRLLANDMSRAVLLRYADRRVVVAPEEPNRFVRDVRQRAGLSDEAGF